ncbi:MAG: DsbE family thiol:disulfide interchange protein [Sphingomonadales bacterium]|nr:DsbE family thiol:disulfide interchange protein [Sphingomonadales bacterium]MDE2169096.1 DsbE family thiol:disulfide interchange protein [Sphingomonadales bacterium]
MSNEVNPAKAPRWTLWLPLALFLGFVVLVAAGLMHPRDTDIDSQMIGKPLPAFSLRAASDGRDGLSTSDFRQGKPHLLNIFASWCVPCGVEAPVLAQLQRQGAIIDGIAIRDHKADLNAFLAKNGNPYQKIGADDVSAVQLAIGSSGVPETFVIDGKGIIRYQHIGDIRYEEIPMMMQKLKDAES